jgi:hypothetical protein
MPGRYRFPRPSRRLRQTRLEPRERQQNLRVMTCRLTEGLSSTWEPPSNAAPQPALPADGPVRSLRQQFSRCADVCRVMPFRPCYPRVGPLPDPDLCCSCVGRSSPGQPSRLRPGPSAAARGPKTGRRRPPTWSASHPATPAARPGMTHRDERNVRRRIKLPSLPNTHRLSVASSAGRCGTERRVLGGAQPRERRAGHHATRPKCSGHLAGSGRPGRGRRGQGIKTSFPRTWPPWLTR